MVSTQTNLSPENRLEAEHMAPIKTLRCFQLFIHGFFTQIQFGEKIYQFKYIFSILLTSPSRIAGTVAKPFKQKASDSILLASSDDTPDEKSPLLLAAFLDGKIEIRQPMH